MLTRNNAVNEPVFLIVHPLDDAPEEKRDPHAAEPLALRGGARLALIALRGYLIVMALLVLYHVLDLAGAFG